jgi:hypothetical protein
MALGFLLWSVIPHFSLTLHAHLEEDGMGPDHSHSMLSRAQLSLAETLAEAAVDAYGSQGVQAEFGLAQAGRSTVSAPDTAMPWRRFPSRRESPSTPPRLQLPLPLRPKLFNLPSSRIPPAVRLPSRPDRTPRFPRIPLRPSFCS